MADQIIFLDTPLWKRKFRIFIRYIKQKLGIEKCLYQKDLRMLKKMYQWTKDFESNRDEFNAMLNEYEDKLIIIKKKEHIIN